MLGPLPPTLNQTNIATFCICVKDLQLKLSECDARIKIFLLDCCQEQLKLTDISKSTEMPKQSSANGAGSECKDRQTDDTYRVPRTNIVFMFFFAWDTTLV